MLVLFIRQPLWLGVTLGNGKSKKKLYLISLVGFIENNKQVDLNYLFPNETEVFASWYSGDIRIPEGELLKKINLGYASVFEKDRFLSFKDGVLISETVKKNKKQNS